jgi:hypothetical protein
MLRSVVVRTRSIMRTFSEWFTVIVCLAVGGYAGAEGRSAAGSKTVMGTASQIGDKLALTALKEGEERVASKATRMFRDSIASLPMRRS